MHSLVKTKEERTKKENNSHRLRSNTKCVRFIHGMHGIFIILLPMHLSYLFCNVVRVNGHKTKMHIYTNISKWKDHGHGKSEKEHHCQQVNLKRIDIR